MIEFLYGEIRYIYSDSLAINVNGVGYEVFMSNRSISMLKKGESIELLIHMHIVEGAISLYGFIKAQERAMFRKLISVSRIGPKLGIVALGVYKPSDIALAIASDDEATLTRIPGLGKKTAQRVILELKDKINSEEYGFDQISGQYEADELAVIGNVRKEAIMALEALGYDRTTAARSVSAVKDVTRVESVVAEALKNLVR